MSRAVLSPITRSPITRSPATWSTLIRSKVAGLARTLGVAASMALALLPAGAGAEAFDVTLVNGHPPVFLWVKHLSETFIPTVDRALAGSGHTIRWSEQYGGSLAKVGGELQAMTEGLAEVGLVPTVFVGSKLLLQNVSYYTPFAVRDPGQVMALVERLHDGVPGMAQSWQAHKVVYLGGGFALDDYLLLTKFPVTSLADLKGRKIGTPGPTINWLKGTGAVGVAADLTTFYNSMKTGVFEGVISFPTAAAAARLHEVAPYVTRVGFGAQYAGGLAANRDWYERLPEPVKAALREGARAYTAAYLAELQTRVERAYQDMVAGGARITELPAEERLRWTEALPNMAQVWAREADAKGLPGTQVLSAYMQAVREAGITVPRPWDQP